MSYTLLHNASYWSYQLLSTGFSVAVIFASKKLFEKHLITDPETGNKLLGFTPLSSTMFHNSMQIGASVLLSTSIYGFIVGSEDRNFRLLASIVSFMSAGTSICAYFKMQNHTEARAVFGNHNFVVGRIVKDIIVGALAGASYYYWNRR